NRLRLANWGVPSEGPSFSKTAGKNLRDEVFILRVYRCGDDGIAFIPASIILPLQESAPRINSTRWIRTP
ncbi:MAG: hypothetical protein II520_04260, partial [Bacilli bacterium]|nr:hypothetical protein [Bacilli bacterium]